MSFSFRESESGERGERGAVRGGRERRERGAVRGAVRGGERGEGESVGERVDFVWKMCVVRGRKKLSVFV